MSLLVWLPLNKDFRNTGLLPNFTNPSCNNFTINSNGQFINCHKGSAVFHFQNDFLNTNKWSIAIWFNKPTAYPSQANAILLCKNTSTSTDCQFYFSVVYGTRLNIGIGTTSSLIYENTFDINTWYHAAATYDGETLKLYLNGELVNSKKMSYTPTERLNLGIGGRSTNTGGTTAYGDDYLINDVRIYDNTLAEKDIKRIYQQKLFEFYPKECKGNLISFKNINGTNGWSSFGFGSYGIPTVVNDITPPQTAHFENIKNNLNDNVIRIDSKYTGTTTATTEIANSINIAQYNIQSGNSVTFSFYAKGDGDSIGRTVRAHIHASQSENTSVTANQGTYITLTSGWTRNVNSFVWKKDGKIGYFNFYIVSHMKKEEHIYVSNFQIEIGGISDYSNSTQRKIIFDKAGFSLKNDLVCSGVTFSGNSAVFNGTSDIIRSKTTGLNISGGTLSIWFLPRTKPSGNGTVMFLDGNSRMSVGLYNNASSFIVSTKTSSQLFPASSVIYGSWNHICVLYGADRVAYNCYLNGVKLTPSSTTINWSETESVMKIGAREIYDSYFDGAIKNIKIFKKQLSEEEILELYRLNGI